MGKKINKKDLIEECIEGVENRVDDDYALTDEEYDLFHKEAKKSFPILSKHISMMLINSETNVLKIIPIFRWI